MQIYPAIDIRRGRVVRLPEGDGAPETVYADDPVAQAERFVAAGATWLHVVDLDRAFETGGDNADCLRRIARLPGVAVQVGGLLRTVEQVRAALDIGAARAVVATGALRHPAALEAIGREVGAARLALALDVRHGRPALRGTTERLELSLEACARAAGEAGVPTLVYRDLDRDGMLAGLDVAAAARLVPLSPEVIVSGGGASLADLRRAQGAGIAGAIVGRALYEGRFTLEEGIACSR